MGAGFRIRLEHDDDAWTLQCGGELDLASADKLEEACDLCADMRPESLLIDGRDLTFIDSAGVTALMRCASRCHANGIALTVEVSDQVREVLSRAGTAVERIVLGKPAVPAP